MDVKFVDLTVLHINIGGDLCKLFNQWSRFAKGKGNSRDRPTPAIRRFHHNPRTAEDSDPYIILSTNN